MTLQTFAAALCGYLLRPRQAFGAVLAYILLGACGLPVFAGFTGGAGVLFGPTGGFLAGLPVMALCASLGRRQSAAAAVLAGLTGLIVVYILGTAGLCIAAKLNFRQALIAGTVPFVLKDALSVAGAVLIARSVRRRLGILIQE